jgi:hypothetical protein
MQCSPDAFDSFIKGKLEEVEVDASLAQHGWQQFSEQQSSNTGNKLKTTRFYIFTGITIVTISILLLLLPFNNKKLINQNNIQLNQEKQEVEKTATDVNSPSENIKGNQFESKQNIQVHSTDKVNNLKSLLTKNNGRVEKSVNPSDERRANDPLTNIFNKEKITADSSATTKNNIIQPGGFSNKTDTLSTQQKILSNPSLEKKKKKVNIIW